MAVLFALGVMSLFWMVVIAGVIFAEKVLPSGLRLSRIVGIALVVLGLWVAVSPGSVPMLTEPDEAPGDANGHVRGASDRAQGRNPRGVAGGADGAAGAEKELTRRSDELARQRQELPWVPVEKEYRFETERGHEDAGGALRRALAAARLPLHVRPRVHGGLPDLLGRGRQVRGRGRPT